MSYQSEWVQGEELTPGERDCAARYEAIRPVVEKYRRPVTVLDLGANLGYFGLRLAREFGAVAVMIERRTILEASCRANALPTTIALQRRLSVADLEALAATEHFDVVLALNVVHHFRSGWRGALDAILKLGDELVIETPPRDDVKACGQSEIPGILQHVKAQGPELLGHFDSHTTPGVRRPMYLIRRPKDRVRLTCVNNARVGAGNARPHVINSTPTEKRITYRDGEAREWRPGLNLWTYCELGGVYPAVEVVVSAMTAAYQAWPDHGDLHPWNFILQGDRVALIDGTHRHSFGGPESLAKSIEWVRNPAGATRPPRRRRR